MVSVTPRMIRGDMGFYFAKNIPDKCCLCGSSEKLKGEHKIKRTAIAQEFGTDTMAIGTIGDEGSRLRHAQSPKSKAFHFASKLCADCNSSRTQGPDRECDRLHKRILGLVEDGIEPCEAFDGAEYAVGTQRFNNIARYFSKLICCHMAEIGAPRPIYIARFAIGSFIQNRVWLAVHRDWAYEQIAGLNHDLRYAAHGGLVVYGDKDTNAPNGFHSTITFGPVQYVFYFRLDWKELLELRLCHSKFYPWACQQVQPLNQTGFTGEHKAWKISHDQRKFRKPLFDRSAGARSAFGA